MPDFTAGIFFCVAYSAVMDYNPIICAIDTPDLNTALSLTRAVSPHVGAIKLGLEFFVANGASGVARLEALGAPVFLDLKFHDIPNTVSKAIAATQSVSPFMMTVHTSGASDMMEAAACAAISLNKEYRPLIVGVTALTSMDEDNLADVGVTRKVDEHVLSLAKLARRSGLDGVVCSSHEITILRKQLPDDFVLVVPGIRPASSTRDDQKRVMTPKEAIALGATYLVIGRPITNADDPAGAAQNILASL